MNYNILKSKVSEAEFADKSPEDLAEVFNDRNIAVLTSRTLSHKNLLGLLSPDEFREAYSVFKAASSADDCVAVGAQLMLSEGLDFGNVNTQDLLDHVFVGKDALRDKLKSLGFSKVSIVEQCGAALIGEDVSPAQIRRVRS